VAVVQVVLDYLVEPASEWVAASEEVPAVVSVAVVVALPLRSLDIEHEGQ
jgi:hypothetical protein